MKWTSYAAAGNISPQRSFSVQQTRWTSTKVGQEKWSFCILCCVLHGDVAEWINTVLQLVGFQLLSADRYTELSGKTKDGGICFSINSGRCSDVTVISRTALLIFLYQLQTFSFHLWFHFIHSDGSLHPTAGQGTGGTEQACGPDTVLEAS